MKNFKTFLAYGLPFGIGMMIWDYFQSGEIDLVKFLFLTVFYGLFMTLFMNFYTQAKKEDKQIDPTP